MRFRTDEPTGPCSLPLAARAKKYFALSVDYQNFFDEPTVLDGQSYSGFGKTV
jgi:hypothetical protein